MAKSLLKLLASFAVVLLLVLGSFYSLNRVGFFNLQKVDISFEGSREHDQFLAPFKKNLQEVIELEEGKSLWKLNLQQIADKVRSQKWVKGAQILRRWPASLSVQIVPKEIKLLYLSKSGKMLPIVPDGSFLDSVSLANSPDVVLLKGENFENNVEMRKKAVQMIGEIPEDGWFSQKNISELNYDGKEGFWVTLIKSGVQVKMGEEHFALKASRVDRVMKYMENRQFDARVIDANLSKKVLVRLRKGP